MTTSSCFQIHWHTDIEHFNGALMRSSCVGYIEIKCIKPAGKPLSSRILDTLATFVALGLLIFMLLLLPSLTDAASLDIHIIIG